MNKNDRSQNSVCNATCHPAVPATPAVWPHGRDLLLLAGVMTIFFFVNFVTASRSPTVWCDEVMLTDPAANRLFGHGFTSTAYYWHGSDDRMYFGPYTGLVYLWMQAFGFNPTAVRSLNYVLTVGAVLLLWVAVRRRRLITNPWMRLLLAALICCDSAITFAYRSARYDVLGLVVVAGVFIASTIERRWVRWIAIAALSALMPWLGLQVVAYSAIMMGCLFVFFWRRILPQLVAAGIGLLAGAAGLYAALKALGLWSSYLCGLSCSYSKGPLLNGASATRENLLHAVLHRLAQPQVSTYLGDYSAVPVIGCVLLMGAWLWRSRRLDFRSATVFGLATAVAIPFVMGGVLGHYPGYYMWMGFLPLAICAVMAFEGVCRAGASRKLLVVCGALFVVACGVGLPLRLLVIGLEWRQRDYSQVVSYVTHNVSSNDWVYCDFPAYYPAKTAAAMIFLQGYQLSIDEKSRISALVIDPDDFATNVKEIGGNWAAVDQALDTGAPQKGAKSWHRFLGGAKLYRLAAYRRLPEK